jgi:predicted site-specific integrase-resolvase
METPTANQNTGLDVASGETPNLISRRVAAEVLKVSTETLKRWGKSGYLKGVRCGPRLIRYHLADVQAIAGGRA